VVCAAITMMLALTAYAVDALNESGFQPNQLAASAELDVHGGDYVIAVYGDRFLIAEGAKLGSLARLDHLLGTSRP
jgi:roadblock/LC7 domain-containing protein